MSRPKVWEEGTGCLNCNRPWEGDICKRLSQSFLTDFFPSELLQAAIIITQFYGISSSSSSNSSKSSRRTKLLPLPSFLLSVESERLLLRQTGQNLNKAFPLCFAPSPSLFFLLNRQFPSVRRLASVHVRVCSSSKWQSGSSSSSIMASHSITDLPEIFAAPCLHYFYLLTHSLTHCRQAGRQCVFVLTRARWLTATKRVYRNINLIIERKIKKDHKELLQRMMIS